MKIENFIINSQDSQVTISFNNSIHNNLFIDYEYSINNGDTWSIPVIKKNNEDNNYYFIITDLINNKKYYIFIKSKNKKDITVIEAIPHFYLYPPIIQNSIRGNSLVNISFKSLNINESDIFYEYSLNNGIDWNTLKIEFNKNNFFNGKIENLTNGKSYNIILRSNNLKQISKSTCSISIIPIGPPESPTSLVSTFNNGILNISFIQGNNNGAQIRGYYYSIDNCITWNILKTNNSNGSLVYGNITNLETDKSYIINLCCYNYKGKSISSKLNLINSNINKKIEKNIILNKKTTFQETILEKLVLGVDTYDKDIREKEIVEKKTFEQEFFEHESYEQDTFEQEPFQQEPFQQEPFQQEPFGQETFEQEPFEQETFEQEPFCKETFEQEPFEQETFEQEPYEQETFKKIKKKYIFTKKIKNPIIILYKRIKFRKFLYNNCIVKY